MSRYIDVDILGIGKANPDVFEHPEYALGWNKAIEIIENAPTADVVEVKRGEWVKHSFDEIVNSGEWIITNDWAGNGFECSNCGRLVAETEMPYRFNFCPNCGADMRTKEKNHVSF